MKNCQNGTFEPVHEIQKKFWPKAFFWSIMKMATRKNIHNLSQGPPNPGFMQEKVQKGDFLKKDSRELKFFSCFRFLWISRRPGTQNWERVVFLPSKNLCRKCEKLKQASLSLSLKIIIIKAKTNNDKNEYLRKKYQVQILNFWPTDHAERSSDWNSQLFL